VSSRQDQRSPLPYGRARATGCRSWLRRRRRWRERRESARMTARP